MPNPAVIESPSAATRDTSCGATSDAFVGIARDGSHTEGRKKTMTDRKHKHLVSATTCLLQKVLQGTANTVISIQMSNIQKRILSAATKGAFVFEGAPHREDELMHILQDFSSDLRNQSRMADARRKVYDSFAAHNFTLTSWTDFLVILYDVLQLPSDEIATDFFSKLQALVERRSNAIFEEQIMDSASEVNVLDDVIVFGDHEDFGMKGKLTGIRAQSLL